MSTVVSVLQTALPVLLTLVIGMLCREMNFLSRDGVDALKKVAVNITLPAVLLHSFATATYDRASILVPALIFAVCCVALLMGMGLAKLLKLGRLPAFLATGFEAGMLGYALFALLFPTEPNSHFAIVDLGQVLFVFTLYKALLCGKDGRKAVIKDIVSSPIIWAIAAGVLLGATGLYDAMGRWGVSGILDSLTDFISAPTGTIILLVVGYDLNLRQIRLKDTAAFVTLRVVTMAILPCRDAAAQHLCARRHDPYRRADSDVPAAAALRAADLLYG